jgi:hypothetical protein
MTKNNINSNKPQPAPKHLADVLDVLADTIRFLGYEGEWLSNQLILDIGLTVQFDEPELGPTKTRYSTRWMRRSASHHELSLAGGRQNTKETARRDSTALAAKGRERGIHVKSVQFATSSQAEREQQRATWRIYREAWDESEYRLNFLRSQTGDPIKRATDEEVLKWANKLAS